MTRCGLFTGIAAMLCLLVLACSDSGSTGTDANVDEDKGYCKVVSKDPLVIESVSGGVASKTTIRYKDEKVVQLVEFDVAGAAKVACLEYKNDSDYGMVTCKDSSIFAIGKEKMPLDEYEKLTRAFTSMCEDLSESTESSSSEIPEDEGSSNSEGFPWDDDGESSSSEEGSLWGDEYSSSSSVSSSSEASEDEEIAWYTISSYFERNVVAANAAKLNCADNTDLTELDGYDVAYEFNDPSNLGHDYIGDYNAYLDKKVESVSAECGSLVLDGSNGLLVPLYDVFKSRGFVVEVRFMPTAEADIGNIFVAEPPGSGKDGWQIRMDNGTDIFFHARDTEVSSSWQVLNVSNVTGAGSVALNEWHTIRVKIFPAKSGSGDIFYTLNIVLDGNMYAVEYLGDMSDLEYGLSIGYDAMHQDAYNRKFFTGKIDYIRYGKITEDGL